MTGVNCGRRCTGRGDALSCEVVRNLWIAQHSHNAAGRLESLVNWFPNAAIISSFAYTRSKEGDPTRITYQDGRYREYTYDNAHRLLTEEHMKADGTTSVFKHTYAYDDAGNRTSKTHEEGQTDPVLDYDYDTYGLNQLTDVDGTTGSLSLIHI